MRELLLLFIIIVLALISLVQPRIGIYGYTWFSLMRPDFLAFTTGRFNYGLYLAAALLIGCWRFYMNGFPNILGVSPARTFLLLLVPVTISTFVAVDFAEAYPPWEQFMRMSIMALVIPLLIEKLEHLRTLFLVTALSIGWHAFWHGASGMVVGGARMTEGVGGFMADNNTFAVALVMVAPFIWYGRHLVQSKILRLGGVGLMLCCIAAVIWTYSRAGALTMALVVLLIAVGSRHRVVVLVVMAVLAVPALYLAADDYMSRLQSLSTLEEDSSAMHRVDLAIAALRVWKDRPVFGVGMGDMNFIIPSRNYMPGFSNRNVVHNSFLQMLVHCGIIAFVLYMYLMFSTLFRMYFSARRMRKRLPQYEAYPRAIAISLAAYLFASLFHPRYAFDFAYMLVMYAACWMRFEPQLLQSAAPSQPAYAPIEVPRMPVAVPPIGSRG